MTVSYLFFSCLIVLGGFTTQGCSPRNKKTAPPEQPENQNEEKKEEEEDKGDREEKKTTSPRKSLLGTETGEKMKKHDLKIVVADVSTKELVNEFDLPQISNHHKSEALIDLGALLSEDAAPLSDNDS